LDIVSDFAAELKLLEPAEEEEKKTEVVDVSIRNSKLAPGEKKKR